MAKVVGGRKKKKKETEAERLARLYRETGILPGVMQLPDDLPEYEIYRPGEGGMEYGAYPRGQADYVSPAEPQVVAGPSQDPGGRGAAAAAAAAASRPACISRRIAASASVAAAKAAEWARPSAVPDA